MADEIQTPADVVIIDTGCANLSSVRFAFERLGARVEISLDEATLRAAPRLVLPGVGTAAAAMASLKARGLDKLIPTFTQPVLGVCLGMQLLMTSSKERGAENTDIPCLGIIPGEIRELRSNGLPLPHMGWNRLNTSAHPLFNGLSTADWVYFVHSFCAPESSYTIASCEYGEAFSAAVARGNFMGVQFHPEKSAAAGAKILKNFLGLTLADLPKCALQQGSVEPV
ncbi:imidazole glycerol phosphate synthase subunit HisH [Shewanella sp. JM162201]|uniref:Imidazole glycerol phosphate synthase subunit HisH n=1 Tax=Shewanella jiangmenensis TaxID=2837387 RepID=A0ABS5V797_9GAMM|nr:imidazole glycerol phosphate synthase subunit HisH [Shewanella jiangmenensis]MBT1445594.1 imidazole glycerol phosphate synthase subunit HisH [Shewanella jiangmenensis]